jgi:hypothetical protein
MELQEKVVLAVLSADAAKVEFDYPGLSRSR